MEHRDDRKDCVPCRYGQLIGQGRNQRVQHQRAVRVHDALGPAGRARGVAHHRRATLVERRPLERFTAGDERLVVERPCRGLTFVSDDDDVREIMCSTECFEDIQQRLVDDDHLVLRVVDDEGEFLGKQAGVQRVDDRTHRGDREVQLEVLALVPQQGGDRVSIANAEFGQRAGKPPGPTGAGAQVGAGDRSRRSPRHHLTIAVKALGALDDARQRERVVVHAAAALNVSGHRVAFFLVKCVTGEWFFARSRSSSSPTRRASSRGHGSSSCSRSTTIPNSRESW